MKTKAHKSHSSSSNSHSSKPFFNKSGEGSFFSNSKETEQPFFSPSILQTKLTIGQPDDKYEQEADQVADQVVQRLEQSKTVESNQESSYISKKPLSISSIQRKCDACDQEEKLQKMDDESYKMEVRRKPIFESNGDPPDYQIQNKSKDPKGFKASSFENRLKGSKGKGSPLLKDARNEMESAIGADFSQVRIHNNAEAVQMNGELGARAFTHGSDIYFNSGQYDAGATEGKRLLAHELTHVVQQGKGGSSKHVAKKEIIQRSPLDSPEVKQLKQYLEDDDENEAIDLMRRLTVAQKEAVLRSTTFKDLAVDAFWNSEMFEAIKAMRADLYSSLKWMFAEGTDWESVKAILGLINSRKALVRTDDWLKEQFVGLCNDEEMAEAVGLLGGTLLQKLSWMEAEGSNWDLVKEKILNTSDASEKTAVYNGTDMKDFFTGLCNDEEMAEAVGLLGGTLLQKLSWMEAEGSNWDLVKAKIRSTAGPGEKVAIYSGHNMRDFFVSICDNDEMYEAVQLLGGGLVNKLNWMLEEGTEREYIISVILSAPTSELGAVQANTDMVAQLEEYLNYERELNGVDTNMDITRQMLERRSVCGPDITTQLDAAVALAGSMFAGWSNTEKDDRCKSLISFETGGIAWDIDQLFNRNHGWILGYRPDCATAQNYSTSSRADEVCGNTVQVGNQCFYAGSPNYIIFGKMMKLCYDHYAATGEIKMMGPHGTVVYKKDDFDRASTLDLVFIYKGLPGFSSTNYEGSRAFTIKGFDASANVPQGDRPNCYPSCPSPYSGSAFTVRWSSFSADREAGRESLRNLNR